MRRDRRRDSRVSELAAVPLTQENDRSPLSMGAMPRVMAIHHSATVGGGSISFLDVLAMLRVDYAVTASCPIEPSALSASLKSDAYEYVPTRVPIPLYNHHNGGSQILSRTFWGGVANYLRFRRKWVAHINSVAPDLVIVNSSVMVLMGSIIHSCGAKSLCLVRETFPPKERSFRTRLLYRLLDKNFNGVLFLSEHDQLSAGLSRTRTGVVKDCLRPNSYLPLDRQEACSELGIPENTFNILFTGGASWIKGLDVALRSLSHLIYSDIRLIVVGDLSPLDLMTGPARLRRCVTNPQQAFFLRSVMNLLQRPRIADRVIKLGTQSDMAQCYSASDVVLFPSNLPHQARPIFEAGSYSLPIIASDFAETREFMEHEINGLTFTPRSAPGLARALTILHEDRPKASNLGKSNKDRALSEHCFKDEQLRLLNFVSEVLSA